jgi:hypothetical protein
MEMYSVVLKRKINIPDKDIKVKVRGGRRFAVGTYKVGNRTLEAWRVLGKAK